VVHGGHLEILDDHHLQAIGQGKALGIENSGPTGDRRDKKKKTGQKASHKRTHGHSLTS
jgi:hypothetical protein